MNYEILLKEKALVKSFFDTATNTVTYVVTDESTKKCAVIDSVLDYEPSSGKASYESAGKVIAYIKEQGLSLEWILETHVHADHLSAAKYLKEHLGGKIGISKAIVDVQKVFGDAFFENETFARDGSQFDKLFDVDEVFSVGGIHAVALYVPGHTPADIAYIIGDSVFVGDTLFMPDYGSARCDFPGGSAKTLYASVQKLYSLPDAMNMYMCHDYLPEGRTEYLYQTTVGEEKKHNVHLAQSIAEEQFVHMRIERDKKLGMPKLIIPSLQVNMRAGEFPCHVNGHTILTIPVNGIFSK